MLSEQLEYRLRSAGARARSGSTVPKPLTGDAIFEPDYPRTWDAFVGQERAKAQLKVACYSARARRDRMDHVLLASGIAGVGKTSLARLIAGDLCTGFVEVSGAVTVDDVRPILRGMQDYDVLFIDEIHQLVQGGKVKAEWLLHLLQDGVLVTKAGIEVMPRVTVVAATTDAQRLPTTILGRFVIKPVLEPYSIEDATKICQSLAQRVGFGKHVPVYEDLRPVAEASNGNPRDMKALLIALRDTCIASGGVFDFEQALEWVGVTRDGLTRLCQDYLLCLLITFDGTGGEKAIASALGEPGPLRHTEQLLIQKGLISLTPKGRELTEMGVERTEALLKERGLLK